MKKRMFAMLLALVMIFSIIPVVASSSDNATCTYQDMLQTAFNEIVLPRAFCLSDFDSIEHLLAPVNNAIDYLVNVIDFESLPDERFLLYNDAIQHYLFSNIIVEIYTNYDLIISNISYSINLDNVAVPLANPYNRARFGDGRIYDTLHHTSLIGTTRGSVMYFIRNDGAVFVNAASLSQFHTIIDSFLLNSVRFNSHTLTANGMPRPTFRLHYDLTIRNVFRGHQLTISW